MKKLNVILLILSFILSGIGSMFLFNAKTSTNDSIQTTAPSNKIESEEVTEYTYKTYEDYFVDYFNLPSEVYTRDETTGVVTIDYTKITKTTTNGMRILSYNNETFFTLTLSDFSGKGKENDPYIVHSLNGFLYFTNIDLFGQTAKSYVELDCDIVLNDEKFDADGNPRGGDGVVYFWKTSYVMILPYLEGNNHVIYGLFADRLNKLCGQDCDKNGDGSCVGKCQENVSLFGGMIQKVSNLTFENIFLSGKKHVYPISSARIYDVVNCHAKNGGIIADASAAGLGYEIFYSMENCTSNLRIKQNETTTSSSSFAGLCFSVGTIKNCVNYGDVIASKKISYMGGFCVSLYEEMNNCINYGNIILDETAYSSGVGGLVGSVNSAKIINCKNYGKVSGEKSLWNVKAGGLAGWLNPNGSPAIVVNCINYGEITNGCGFAGQGMVSSFFNCINYGNIKKLGCAFVYKMFTEGSMVAAAQSVINCVNYGEIENTEKTQFGVLFTNFNFKSSLDILNCQNYGTISGVSSSDIVDFFGTIEGDSKVNIVNFRQKSRISNSNNSDFYLLSSVKENSTCLIKTSYFEFQNTSAKFVSNINQNAALKMYNIVLISQHGANANYFLMNDVSGLLVLENIIIQRSLNKSFSKTTKDPLCKVLRATASINYNNVLIESIGNDKTRKEYVGNDFNDFYFSWKTGKIGLIALDGRGQFQGAIDEDWLKGRGYEKREV